jgi:ribosome-associated heat shock protein Hsp15
VTSCSTARGDAPPGAPPERLRLDKWLWQARFWRTRTLAAEAVGAGKVRVNGTPSRKPGHAVAPGDTLTLSLPSGVRVVRVTACGTRRGNATEARGLYIDLSPEPHDRAASPLE